MKLFDLYNADIGHAFPSREYLARELGSHEASISEWTSVLRKVGALETRAQGELHQDLRTSGDPRSLAYFLNFEWAEMVLAIRDQADGLAGARPPVRRSVVKSTTQPIVKSTSDLGSEVHYTDNLSGQPTDNREKNRTDIKGKGVYARDVGEELPFDPPETIEEAIEWLRMRGLSDLQMQTALPMLRAGKLYPSQIEHMKSTRRAA